MGSKTRLGGFGLLLALLLTASCSHMGGRDALLFPKLRSGAASPAPTVRLTGTLIRDGAFLRVAGNGNTVVIWPAGAEARAFPGNGNLIVVWPRNATVQHRADGGGTTIVVWARAIGAGTPVRIGDRVEFSGIVLVDNLPALTGPGIITADNVSGRLANCPRARGCTGPVFVATSFRLAPAGQQ